jgi:plasmid maintenance system antidote protein VapI
MNTLKCPVCGAYIRETERTERLLKRVEKWRQDHAVTQKDLAGRLGMTPQQLNDIIKGRTQLTGEQALHLQEIINTKPKRRHR